MRWPYALLLSALLVPSFSGPADAAMCVTFSVEPDPPVTGERAKVVAREQWQSIGFTNARGLPLIARRPGFTDIPIPTRRSTDDVLRWEGSAVFPAAGEWAIRVAFAADENRYPCFERRVLVAADAGVASAPGQGPPSRLVVDSLAFIGAFSALTAIALLLHAKGLRTSR